MVGEARCRAAISPLYPPISPHISAISPLYLPMGGHDVEQLVVGHDDQDVHVLRELIDGLERLGLG